MDFDFLLDRAEALVSCVVTVPSALATRLAIRITMVSSSAARFRMRMT